MTTSYKTVNGDYTITCNEGLGIFTVNAANLIFNGNITQSGNTTIVDPFLVVAANNTGTITDMGVLAQTGPTTFAGLRFDVTANAWQISNSVNGSGGAITSYANILTTVTAVAVGGSNTQIQFNDSGNFGASANLSFDKVNNRLFLGGHQVFANTAAPANVANAVALYSNAVSSGGTGLYFTSAAANDELVSKSAAIVFAIIF